MESRRFGQRTTVLDTQKLLFSARFLRFDISQSEGNIFFFLALFTGFRMKSYDLFWIFINYFIINIIIILYSLERGYIQVNR